MTNNTDKTRVYLLKLYLGLIVVLLLTNVFSLIRGIGIWNAEHSLILFVRICDISFVLCCGIAFSRTLKLKTLHLAVIALLSYPIFIGFWHGNSLSTLLNDVALYYLLIIKIWIFHHIFSSPAATQIFNNWTKKYIGYVAAMAALMLCAAYSLEMMGYAFHFQAPLDITYAMSLAAANNQYAWLMYFLVFSLLAGKRMMAVGAIVIVAFAVARLNRRIMLAIFKWSGVVLLLAVILNYFYDEPITGLNKWTVLFDVIAQRDGQNLLELLKLIDPGRYIEIVSLWGTLEGIDIWVGKGYGYRYSLDLSLLDYSLLNYETQSNSHFSPLGVVSKFGFFGFAIWSIFIFYFLKKSFKQRRVNYHYYASFLFLISLLVQSLMAFSFFVNIWLPIVLGYVIAGKNGSASNRWDSNLPNA